LGELVGSRVDSDGCTKTRFDAPDEGANRCLASHGALRCQTEHRRRAVRIWALKFAADHEATIFSSHFPGSSALERTIRCLSNNDISNSIRAIAAINPPSTTGGSLFGLVGNSSGAVAGTAGSPAAPASAAVLLRYSLDHLRNDQMLTRSSLGEVVRRHAAGLQPLRSGDLEVLINVLSGFALRH
jgi:hypothetical protein